MSHDDAGIDYAGRAKEELGFSRWWQVVAAIVMMGLISPYQYVWTSIEGPLSQALNVEQAAIGLVFTLFVVFQAGSQVPVGWWRDRHGPRALTVLAGLLAGGGYLGLAVATSVWHLYLFYSLGAVGVGIVYTVAVNTALKWFPDRRGLTTGLGTMAFAGGSALVVGYVIENATPTGYAAVLTNMGLVIGAGILVGAFVLRDPPSDWLDDVDEAGASSAEVGSEAKESSTTTDGGVAVTRGRPQYSSKEMLRTWQFWLMYAMFVAVSGAGLMLTAKIVQFAQNFQLTENIVILSATALPIAGGVGRLVMGWVSDRVDRERAMFASFSLCGLGLLAVTYLGAAGLEYAFIGAVFVATFFWSPQYTLFPSVVGDYYGTEHSSANYAYLYTGKMWGGLFGGAVAGFLVTTTSWETTFTLGGALAILAGLAALALRDPRA